MEQISKIDKFVTCISGYGSGSGNGRGRGNGDGNGDGDGRGYGRGYGRGNGSGNGRGSGYGSGYGSGNGRGYGRGISLYNNYKVYHIDGVQTIITSCTGNIAKGFIVNDDLTLTKCYIAKQDQYFAHGTTIKQAIADVQSKVFDNMDIDDKISYFKDKFKIDKPYPTTELYKAHNFLTGSCEMGRQQFAKQHNINMQGTMTVREFINLTAKDGVYGCEIIKQLADSYGLKFGSTGTT